MTKDNYIGERIKQARIEQGWNQQELADSINTCPSMVSMCENGRRKPSLKIASTLSKVFNKKPYHFLHKDYKLPVRVSLLEIEREKRKLSQSDVADCLGIKRQLLSAYERGLYMPSGKHLLLLSKFYEINPKDLEKSIDERRSVIKHLNVLVADLKIEEISELIAFAQKTKKDNRDKQ